MKTKMNNLIKVFAPVVLLLGITISIACSPNSTSTPQVSPSTIGKSQTTQPVTSPPTTTSQTVNQPSAHQNTVSIVVAGFINHGPMRPTVNAIKEVLAKYGDKVTVTWIDLSTKDGADYFKQNGLTAHMNVIINGTYKYKVNGRDIEFQWFEGQQWTKQDLDAVLSDLTNK